MVTAFVIVVSHASHVQDSCAYTLPLGSPLYGISVCWSSQTVIRHISDSLPQYNWLPILLPNIHFSWQL